MSSWGLWPSQWKHLRLGELRELTWRISQWHKREGQLGLASHLVEGDLIIITSKPWKNKHGVWMIDILSLHGHGSGLARSIDELTVLVSSP